MRQDWEDAAVQHGEPRGLTETTAALDVCEESAPARFLNFLLAIARSAIFRESVAECIEARVQWPPAGIWCAIKTAFGKQRGSAAVLDAEMPLVGEVAFEIVRDIDGVAERLPHEKQVVNIHANY